MPLMTTSQRPLTPTLPYCTFRGVCKQHTCRHQGLGELADGGVGSARSSARNEVLSALPDQIGCPSRTTQTYKHPYIHTRTHRCGVVVVDGEKPHPQC